MLSPVPLKARAKYPCMLLHKDKLRPLELKSNLSLSLKGPYPVLLVRASVKSVKILCEDKGLSEIQKCNFPELQGIEERDGVTSNPLPATELGSCCTHC